MTDESDNFDPDQTSVAFDYLKAPNFQSLRADGAIGGVTPNGRIHMSIYSERPAIPRRVVHELTKKGTLGKLLEVQSRNSIVREMSADVFLDLRAAESIHDWLGQQVEELKARLEENDE